MIDDPELKILFQAESEERFNHLEESLKILEEDPGNIDTIGDMFRDAHTIKGNAAMLGVHSIEKIAHKIEDILDKAKSLDFVLSPKLIGHIYAALQGMRLLLKEEISGTPGNVDLNTILQSLGAGEQGENTEHSPPQEPSPRDEEPTPKIKQESYVPLPTSDTHPDKLDLLQASQAYQTSVIRIPVTQMNALIAQAGDLRVVTNHIVNLFDKIDKLLILFETTNLLGTVSLKQFVQEVSSQLTSIREYAYENIHKLELVTTASVELISKLGLVPLSKLFSLFSTMVDDLAKASNKEVELIVEGGQVTVDKRIIEGMKDPLMHMLRNAISHGIELPEERVKKGKRRKGKIRLTARQDGNVIYIEVEDDGCGLDLNAIRAAALRRNLYKESEIDALSQQELEGLIFLPGFTTSEHLTNVSGRGVGMDVVADQVERLYGTIVVSSRPGFGCKFQITMSTILVTTQVLLIDIIAFDYVIAIPIEVIVACKHIAFDQLFAIEGQDVVYIDGVLLPVVLLPELLDLPPPPGRIETLKTSKRQNIQGLILKIGGKQMVVLVDAIIDEQKIAVTPLHPLLSGLTGIAGATILKTGRVCLVMNPVELIKKLHGSSSVSLGEIGKSKRKGQQQVLIVDDSPVAREVLKRMLEMEGYEVISAEDGNDALQKFHRHPNIQAVIADVEMPGMDGLTLCTKIRLEKNSYTFPVILVSTHASAADIKRGVNAGASAYLGKSNMNQLLIQTLRELL